MKEIKVYYNDSPTKSRTRYKILNAAAILFSENGIEAVTMIEIAKEANIAVRNLYRYYSNIEFLAVDTIYYIFSNETKLIDFVLNENCSGFQAIEMLIDKLISIYTGEHHNINITRFVMFFDMFISTLDKENPAFILYTTKYVPEFENDFSQLVAIVLKKGIADGSIINVSDIESYSTFILQSLLSLLMRVDIKEYENPLINKSLIEKQVELILYYLKN